MPEILLSDSDYQESGHAIIPIYGDNEEKLFPLHIKWAAESFNSSSATQLPRIQQIARYSGLVSGAISGMVAGPLGYYFGESMVENVDSKFFRTAASGYFGATAAAAIMALSARISANTWSNALSKTPKIKQELAKKGCSLGDVPKYTLTALSYVIGSLSAAPTVYVTHEFFANYMDNFALLFDIPTLLSLATVLSWTMEKTTSQIFHPLGGLVAKLFASEEQIVLRAIKSSLINKLHRSINIVKGLTDDEASQLASIIIDNNTADSYDQKQTVKSLKYVFNPNMLPILSNKKPLEDSKLQRVFGLLGALTGLLTPYASYPLGKTASNAIWDLCGVTDIDFREHSGRMFGVSAYMGLAALGAFATLISFEKFYSWVMQIPSNLRKLCDRNEPTNFSLKSLAYDALVLIIAIGSATPRAELNREQMDPDAFYTPIFIGSALISGFASDYWAIDQFILDNISKKSNKQHLIGLISNMANDLQDFDDKHIAALNNTLELENMNGTNINNEEDEEKKSTVKLSQTSFGIFSQPKKVSNEEKQSRCRPCCIL
jgi:hypothetical protein